MGRLGQGPRPLGRNFSWLGGRDFPDEPPIPETPGPKIFLGRTLEGKEFSPDGRALEKVNVIVGAKGSGKSHLAKVILLGSRGSSSGWSLRSGAL